MFRTRDFILFFTVIVFLLVAIGATVFDQWRDNRVVNSQSEILIELGEVASSSDLVLTGSLPDNAEKERIQRLNNMRIKIAAANLSPETPEIAAITEDVATTSITSQADELVDQDVLSCTGFAPYLGFWDSRGATVSMREGAVLVERTLDTGPSVVLQLPARSLPAAAPSCVGSDVVGIANDGSLIRNDEFALYGIFGNETRIGYALDGLPIYGVGTMSNDVCGGRMVAGQYRYELSPSRTTILNCFAAAPVQLP